jgi:putative transposase
MKKQRFTEEQISGVLREQEAGAKTADLCRRHGISEATYYNWKAKYSGMEVSEARRLKALEDENARLSGLDHARSAIAEWADDYIISDRTRSDTRPRQTMPGSSPQPAPTLREMEASRFRRLLTPRQWHIQNRRSSNRCRMKVQFMDDRASIRSRHPRSPQRHS